MGQQASSGVQHQWRKGGRKYMASAVGGAKDLSTRRKIVRQIILFRYCL